MPGLAVAAALIAPSSVGAATLVSPTEGAEVPSTPTFSWLIASGEESDELQMSTNPAPGENGGFANDDARRTEFLDRSQTAFAVGDAEPLNAGVWFWHVRTYDQDYDSHWSPVGSFRVRDEPPVLKAFSVDDLDCIDEVSLELEYFDNSESQLVRWRLDFTEKRNGPRKARIRGTATDGSMYESVNTPSRLKRGKRYWIKLSLQDPAAQEVVSKPRRLLLGRC